MLMPELPEVETVRRGLAPILEGALIERAEQRRPDLRIAFPERFAERLGGRRVLGLRRRAKYLLAALDDGIDLVMHMGMSGSFRVEGSQPPAPPGSGAAAALSDAGLYYNARQKLGAHDHVVLHLTGGRRIIYNDPRRFGIMTLIADAEIDSHPLFRHLGVDPTGNAFSAQVLAAAFKGKAAPLKAALLDQRIIAGLGNIYACEALWQARLSPARAAGSLVRADGRPSRRLEKLVEAVRRVLADAIAAGGSSLRDYVQANGELGMFQHRFAVYDLEGEPCSRPGCRGIVGRIVQSGRSTFLCPRCQR
jgi:formamidopyrimidine-DNA glycosylase